MGGGRAGVKILPEKGRQGAVSGVRRTSEGGKRSCSLSEELVGAKEACFLNGAYDFLNTQPDLF